MAMGFCSCSSEEEVAKEEQKENTTEKESESEEDKDSLTIPINVIDDEGDIDVPDDYKAMNDINNAFSWKLFAYKVRQEAEKKNVLASPFSMATYLAMMDNGAAGTSRDELTKLLGFDGYDIMAVNLYYNIMTRGVVEVDPSVKFTSCNGLWYASEMAPKSDFIGTLQSWYGAETKVTDLTSQTTLEEINSWVREKTEGMIEKIYYNVEQMPYPFALLNAVYLKAAWMEAFDESLTMEYKFETISGNSVKPEFMWKLSIKQLYYKGDNFAATFIPLGDNAKMDAFFILPDEGVGLATMVDHLADSWADITSKADSTDLTMGLPKFDISYSSTWTDYMASMGCSDIFDPTKADFTPMSDMSELTFPETKQIVRFIANEKGVEGAAVTGSMWSSSGDDIPSLLFDHPFFFGVREKSTGVILFMGCVVDPTD